MNFDTRLSFHMKATLFSALSISLLLHCLLVSTAGADQSPPPTQLAPVQLQVANVTIDVSFASGTLTTPREALLQWITTSAQAVAHYYGRFPVPRLRLLLTPESDRAGVRFGTTFGGASPAIKVWLGQFTNAEMLQHDWVMTHEMVHLAFPHVPKTHHWIEEGIATYVEPLARFGIRQVSVEKVWRDLVQGLPHGLPKTGDQGLDHTPTWGRTYWGGALFCLLADLEIRQRTDNRRGLQDALQAIVAAGGTMAVRWPVTRALAIGDQAIGAPVLTELYERMKAAPAPVDLVELWQRLGVDAQASGIVFHDTAPLASVRQAINAAAQKGGAVASEHASRSLYRASPPVRNVRLNPDRAEW